MSVLIIDPSIIPTHDQHWGPHLHDELSGLLAATIAAPHLSSAASPDPYYFHHRSAINPRFHFLLGPRGGTPAHPLNPECVFYMYSAPSLLQAHGLSPDTHRLSIVLEIDSTELIAWHNTFMPLILPPANLPFSFFLFWASAPVAVALEVLPAIPPQEAAAPFPPPIPAQNDHTREAAPAA